MQELLFDPYTAVLVTVDARAFELTCTICGWRFITAGVDPEAVPDLAEAHAELHDLEDR